MNKPLKLKRPPEPSEYFHQVHIFQFAEIMQVQYPELRLLNGSLNGVRLSIGQAVKAKRAGMKAGFPDIFLPVARSPYNGLFIELKKKSGSPITKEQKAWIEDLVKQGYCAMVCRGADMVKAILIQYLRGEL